METSVKEAEEAIQSVKRKAEKQKANKSEQTIFRDDLMGRVDKLENEGKE